MSRRRDPLRGLMHQLGLPDDAYYLLDSIRYQLQQAQDGRDVSVELMHAAVIASRYEDPLQALHKLDHAMPAYLRQAPNGGLAALDGEDRRIGRGRVLLSGLDSRVNEHLLLDQPNHVPRTRYAEHHGHAAQRF